MSDDIEAMIRATIQTKVIEAFNTAPDIIEKMIRAALEQKVNEYGGKPDAYSRGDAMPYLDWLVGEEIRNATRNTVREYIAEHKDTIKAKISTAIGEADFASAIGVKMGEVLTEEYAWNVTVSSTKNG